jgi:transcriptional regulator with XRE-family HTH domain
VTGETVSDIVAARIKEARKARDWRTADLAEQCEAAGHPELTRSVIENIESGRRRDGKRTRDVTVDELRVLADVLHFSPADVLGGLPPGTIGSVTVDQLEEIANLMLTAASFQRWRAEQEGELEPGAGTVPHDGHGPDPSTTS